MFFSKKRPLGQILAFPTVLIDLIIEYSSDWIATGSEDMLIKVWEGSDCVATLEGHTGFVISMILLPKGRLASGSDNSEIKIWNLQSGKCEQNLVGHTSYVLSLAVLSDGALVSSSDDFSIRIWDVQSGECQHVIKEHTGDVFGVTALPKNRFASCSYDKTVRLWQLNTVAHTVVCIGVMTGHTKPVTCITTLPDDRLATGSYDDTIRLWDALTKQCIATLPLNNTQKWLQKFFTFSDDCVAALGFEGRSVEVWNVKHKRHESGVFPASAPAHLSCFTMRPDRRWVLGSGSDLISYDAERRKNHSQVSEDSMCPDEEAACENNSMRTNYCTRRASKCDCHLQCVHGAHSAPIRCIVVLK